MGRDADWQKEFLLWDLILGEIGLKNGTSKIKKSDPRL